MTTSKKNPRKYNCKDEELSTIGGYVITSIRRDQAKFVAYSPKYNNEGIMAFEQENNAVDELVNPKTEIADLKVITGGLYASIDDIFDKAKRIEGYIVMSKGEVPISAKDFGITALKQRTHSKDAEGVLQNARLVLANMKKYQEPLAKQGLTTAMVDRFAADIAAISAGNQKQYDMVGNRKAIVQANLDVLNALSEKIKDACTVGKILFRGNAEKLKEYTFTELKKRVRNANKPKKNDSNGKDAG